jgi:hypothetical protein
MAFVASSSTDKVIAYHLPIKLIYFTPVEPWIQARSYNHSGNSLQAYHRPHVVESISVLPTREQVIIRLTA